MRKTILSLCMLLLGILTPTTFAQELINQSWRAEYFNNPYLAGTPIITRQDARVGFDWGFESPDTAIPTDNFSVRWGKGGYLPAGTYRFIITADESFRLYVDNQVIIDTWDAPQIAVTLGRDIVLSEGFHQIQIDFREFSGTAFIYLDWGIAQTDTPTTAVANSTTTSDRNVTVATSRLNVRSEPRIANNVIERVTRGQQFPLLEQSADGLWVRIQLRSGVSGWVSSQYVRDSVAGRDLNGLTLRSNARLLIRTSPNTDASVLGLLQAGQVAQIVGRNGDATWWQVQADGFVGWINGDYVTLSPDVEPFAVTITN